MVVDADHSTRAWIVTCHRRFVREALAEIERHAAIADITELDHGVVLVLLEASGPVAPHLAAAFQLEPPIFVEHLAPAGMTVAMAGERRDLDLLIAACVDAITEVPRDAAIAVDCRRGMKSVTGRHVEARYTARDVEIAVGEALADRGRTIDLVRPSHLIHVFLAGKVAYLGAAPRTYSLRRHGDRLGRGRTEIRISRAEEKLAEAIEVFGVRLPARQHVLDLGSAPGGWSYLLAEAGCDVVAVDPAELHPLAAKHPRIDHWRQRAETIPDWSAFVFDAVVNDMALDPPDSAEILARVARGARPGAVGVFTLKLPTRNVRRWTDLAEQALVGTWTVIARRHLAANRQELTWLLERQHN